MKAVVISGGTDGIGRGLADAHLRRGDTVVVIGRSPEKGRAFLAAAKEADAAARATFLQADLSLVGENQRIIRDIKANFGTVDALELCARYYRSTRSVTGDGFEHTFALFYLSRFLLSHSLVESLAKADQPVIMNVAGPGSDLSVVHWDDLGLERGYHGVVALTQGGKLNDLLGVAFADIYRASRIRYVLFNPGPTSTSFAGEYDPPTATQIERMKERGRSVEEAIVPIIAGVDAPPAEPLSAFLPDQRITVADGSFAPDAAARLHQITRNLLSA